MAQMTFQQIKEDIYNYSIHESMRDELLEKRKVNARVTQRHSYTTRNTGYAADSVSGELFRRLGLEMRIKKINEKMEYIDQSMPLLNELEREVINYSKQGYKMSQIAIKLRCSRRRVEYERNKAIDKILKNLCGKEKLRA